MPGSALSLRKAGLYSVYVLFLLLLAYLLNQLDRYTLAIVTSDIAKEVHYGDLACLKNTSYSKAEMKGANCNNGTTKNRCLAITNKNGSNVCEWDYNGQGLDYQIVAGPVFILIYTFMGIFLGFAADQYNRKNLLAICLIFWSIMTLLTGFVNEFWQLIILRLGLGIGEAGCTPFAASLIADYFVDSLRASAMGVYNWGIYTGYSMSYALGNFVSLSLGWRWVFIISGIPGIVLGVIILFTVREPVRGGKDEHQDKKPQTLSRMTKCQRLGATLKPFTKPSLMMLILAGSIRNAAGYVWAYNTQPYFESIGETSEQIGTYMSWIPLVGGSLGVVVGGFISDKVIKKQRAYGRIIVLVASQILAAPFAAGALFLPTPWAYLSLLPGNIIGEMWVGVCLTVVVELVPTSIRTSAVAVYLFVITNIGGNIPLLVPVIQKSFHTNMGLNQVDSLRASLYILYPGMYVLGSVLFLLTILVLRHDLSKVPEDMMPVPLNEEDAGSNNSKASIES